MSARLFDHIDLRVSSLARVSALYDAFLLAVGFSEIKDGGTWRSYSVTDAGCGPRPPFIQLDELPSHRGGANRIAFWADTEEEVNRVGAVVRAAGAQIVEGPEYCFEYTPGYYAVFFEDADANKWEVCCRVARVRTNPDQP